MNARSDRLLGTIFGPRIFRFVQVPYYLYWLGGHTRLRIFTWLGGKAERFEDRFARWVYARRNP